MLEDLMPHPQGTGEPESPQAFAQRLNLDFSRPSLLTRALTHRSYLNEHPESALEDNERLEFLGDAVLDFLVGAWLYNHFPWMSEGELTRLRSALVRTEQLAEFAQDLGFGPALRLGRGEGAGGGRQSSALLCATFEAVVGALYLDQGLEAVSKFIEPLMSEASGQILATNRDQDPKSIFQERIQALGYPPPVYQSAGHSGPEHQKVFNIELLVDGQVYAVGEGQSKQQAAKVAARAALERLDDEPLPVKWKLRNGGAQSQSAEE
jgi:ribonuclease III